VEVKGGGKQSESSRILWLPRSKYFNAAAQAELDRLAGKYNYLVHAGNYPAFLVDLYGALETASAGRPVLEEHDPARTRAELQRSKNRLTASVKNTVAGYAEKRRQAAALAPEGAIAMVVACFEVDQSDPESAQYSTRTEKVVAIGWRFSIKENFARLRAVADTYPPTRHLGTRASNEVEHRENWRRGRGNYLKAGPAASTGWYVHSVPLTRGRLPQHCPLTDLHLPSPGRARTLRIEVSEPTVMINNPYNTVEIRFPARPPGWIRADLKRNQWRWLKDDMCWSRGHSPASMSYATNLIIKLKGDS